MTITLCRLVCLVCLFNLVVVFVVYPPGKIKDSYYNTLRCSTKHYNTIQYVGVVCNGRVAHVCAAPRIRWIISLIEQVRTGHSCPTDC